MGCGMTWSFTNPQPRGARGGLPAGMTVWATGHAGRVVVHRRFQTVHSFGGRPVSTYELVFLVNIEPLKNSVELGAQALHFFLQTQAFNFGSTRRIIAALMALLCGVT